MLRVPQKSSMTGFLQRFLKEIAEAFRREAPIRGPMKVRTRLPRRGGALGAFGVYGLFWLEPSGIEK